ncbi:SAM-dependent methyltransferase [Streptomyces sp. NPDC058316]|uniref:SAM-dependent methyltransferase n=1 Tax=unclassified Streptomyces TaxID=2593676 RepID=UPI00332782B4
MSTAVRHLLVIGVGCGAPDHLTFAAARAMHRADVLSVLSKGRGKSALLRLRPDGTDS